MAARGPDLGSMKSGVNARLDYSQGFSPEVRLI